VRRPGKTTTNRIKIGDPATMPLVAARARAQELMRDPGELEAETDAKTDQAVLDDITADSPMALVITTFIQRDQMTRNRSWREVDQILKHDLGDWDAGRSGRLPEPTCSRCWIW
jgi:hypothetical protein